ncbi:MAG: hypothetical protein Q3971_00125 [Moraxella sp.]|nr:hypothetical protein [Moraxella sp.]
MTDNAMFIKYLQDLSQNRFALNTLNDDTYRAFLRTLLAQFGQHNSQRWYLIGTDGCHLCDDTARLMHRLGVDFIRLELTDTHDDIIDTLGMMIPILLTPTKMLCAPFGVMDIMALFDYKK